MDYKVTMSLSARRDLEDIVRYISLDVPERAIEFGQFLISKTKSLGQFPEIGRGADFHLWEYFSLKSMIS